MTPETESRLLDGLWRTVAERGWAGTTLSRVAEAAGVPLADVRAIAACPLTCCAATGGRWTAR